MREPSDHPSFYDPEHPLNQPASAGPMPRWWVELLCDGGKTFGGSYAALTEHQAGTEAMRDAKEWGYRPVEVESCEREDDDE